VAGAADIFREAVRGVHTAFLDAAVDVTHEAYGGQDSLGTEQPYGAPILRKAMVDRKEGLLPTPDGQAIRYRAAVSFVEVVDVDARDRVTLPDGLTGPLYVPQGGTLDPATGQPYARTVYLR
jgi:hypothetical protein